MLQDDADADMLVRELPHGTMVRASSILELRITPKRLTTEIAKFVDSCWGPKPALPRRRRHPSANGVAKDARARRRPA